MLEDVLLNSLIPFVDDGVLLLLFLKDDDDDDVWFIYNFYFFFWVTYDLNNDNFCYNFDVYYFNNKAGVSFSFTFRIDDDIVLFCFNICFVF